MMTIKHDDPWYPCHIDGVDYPGASVRLKLAAEMMKSPHLLIALGISCGPATHPEDMPSANVLIEGATALADAMISRANREEGKHDDPV